MSPDNVQFSVGYTDGSTETVHIDHADKIPHLHAKAHLSTVTDISFFPSSKVTLTSGADFTICILTTESRLHSSISPSNTIEPARVLKGHTRSVTKALSIARGRKIVSASEDGTVRMWEVSSARQIALTHVSGGSPITGMLLISDPYDGDIPAVAICALRSGMFEIIKVEGKTNSLSTLSVYDVGVGPLTCIGINSINRFIAIGSASGIITLFDVSNLEVPLRLKSCQRNSAAITSIAFCPDDLSFLVTTADGLPFVAAAEGDENTVVVKSEFLGSDCTAVVCGVVSNYRGIWLAWKDMVRAY